MNDGSKLTVLSPVIRGDSLFGKGLFRWIRQGNRAPKGLNPVALSLTSIRGAAVEETDGTKTLLAVSALVVCTVGLIAAVVDISNDCYSFAGC
jgi:hypothetical protein